MNTEPLIQFKHMVQKARDKARHLGLEKDDALDFIIKEIEANTTMVSRYNEMAPWDQTKYRTWLRALAFPRTRCAIRRRKWAGELV